MFLSIGSGSTRYKDTLNLDIEDAYNVDIVADARKIPFEDEYFDGVIASHVLEHFRKEEHIYLLREWRRVIKPNGKIYICCPDFIKCVKYYAENRRGLRFSYWEQTIFGLFRGKGDIHLSGITDDYLTDLLFKTGFVDLKWSENMPEYFEHNLEVIATKGNNKNKEDKLWLH
jgi:SAM-dependent methyltransferase